MTWASPTWSIATASGGLADNHLCGRCLPLYMHVPIIRAYAHADVASTSEGDSPFPLYIPVEGIYNYTKEEAF